MFIIENSGRRATPRQFHVHCYDWAERDAIFKAAFNVTLDESGAFPFAHFLGLVMLAGLRPEEALLMRWEAPSVQAGRYWAWPDMKSWQIFVPEPGPRSRRCVPIIPQLARLLAQWPLPKKSQLFPFRVTGSQIDACWQQTLQMAGTKPVGIHALNGTFALIMRDIVGLKVAEVNRLLSQPRRHASAESKQRPHRRAPV